MERGERQMIRNTSSRTRRFSEWQLNSNIQRQNYGKRKERKQRCLPSIKLSKALQDRSTLCWEQTGNLNLNLKMRGETGTVCICPNYGSWGYFSRGQAPGHQVDIKLCIIACSFKKIYVYIFLSYFISFLTAAFIPILIRFYFIIILLLRCLLAYLSM